MIMKSKQFFSGQNNCLNKETIVLFTHDFSGHRLDWLSKLAQLASDQSKHLTIAVIDTSRLANVQIASNVSIVEFTSKRGIVRFLNSTVKGSRIVTWDGDQWLLFSLFIRKKTSMLIMRPYLTNFSIQSISTFCFKRIIICVLKLLYSCNFAFLAIPFSTRKNIFATWVDDELLMSQAELSLLRKKREERPNKVNFDILLPGYISKRKNAELLIKACSKLNHTSPGIFRLSIKGKIEDEDLYSYLPENTDWLRIENRYFDRSEYFKLLADSDLVAIPYSNVASSGVAMECLAIGVPVIVSEHRLWRNLERNFANRVFLSKLDVQHLYYSIIRSYQGDQIIDQHKYHEGFLKISALKFLLEGSK